MAVNYNPLSTINGLIFYIDAGNTKSFVGSGNTWSDFIGNNQGTLTNSPTFNNSNNGFFSFDGTDDFVNYGDLTQFNLTGTATIETWIRIPSTWTTGSLYPSIIGKGPTSGWDTDGWSLFAFRPNSPGTENWIGVGMRNGGTTNIRYFTNTLLNQWMQIIASWDGTTITMYQNTIERVNISQQTTPASTSQPLRIARDNGTQYLNANIAMTKIYNRVLTASERLDNYNATRGRFGI